MFTRHFSLALCALSALVLAACGTGQPGGQQTASPAGSQQPVTSAAPAPVGHYHAELALAGQPEVTADGKSIQVTVNVTNDGPAPFGTQATPAHNVNLGAHSIDVTGKVLDNDLARGSLPEVAPGATANATILLPLDKVLGNRAELLPVEEGVGWFDKWGTKPLVVGPFVACHNPSSGKVCDAAAKLLPVASAP